jgi:5'-methylthioadenosine phosphorylase
MVKIGIIGGSGLDNPNIIKNPLEKEVTTPYGNPSSKLTVGKMNNVDVVILSRHGKTHNLSPSGVPYRANIQALKQENCTHILATTACGSLREEIERGHLVILDQFIDFTRHRAITFHEEFKDNPVHTPMAHPFNEELRKILIKTCKELKLPHHEKGTVITIEGPRFSTKAESHMFRQWGADVINMSIAPEAILANELGIPYAAIAMSTDFDSWRSDENSVTWEEILKVFNDNAEKVKSLLVKAIPRIKDGRN